MATHLDSALLNLSEEMGRFARAEIATRKGIRDAKTFPHDLWGKLTAEKLLGIGIPETFGGRGGDYLAILVAEEAMVKNGRNMGFSLSWLIQEVVARFVILNFGSDKIKNLYLPQLAKGSAIAALAISEPGVGAHPKHLTTSAVRRDGSWIINGKKTMITNGPIADLFVVIAVTDQSAGRKAFTAFLIPKETPGLILTETMDLGFLQPSQHGTIELVDCTLDDTHIVGTEGKAYQDIALPFREIEDMLLAGVVTGGLGRLLELSLEKLRVNATSISRDIKIRLGELGDFIDTLSVLAYEAAAMVDSGQKHEELSSLLLTFKSLAARFLDMYGDFIAAAAIGPGPEGEALLTDLNQTIRIARNVTDIKRMKRGDDLLLRKE